MSYRPEYRIKELQTGNPYKIVLLLKVSCDDCRNIESEVHRYFGDNRESGEWFKVDDTITTFVKYLKHIEYEMIGRD